MFLTNNTGNLGAAAESAFNFAAGLKESTEALQGLNRATSITDANVGKIITNMGTALASPGTVLKETAQLQDLSYKLARESMGNAIMVGDALNATMAEALVGTSEFGVSLDDNLNLMKQINDAMQVNTLLTSEQVINMQALAKSAGVTSAEIVPIVKGFADMGRSTEYAIEQIGEMQDMARKYGINAGQFIKMIGDNVKYLSSYNFKDGVEGLSRMTAKAQALRLDMGQTFKMAFDLMEPEKAIEMAAGFQMLGGAVGDLGDPFKLLHMAQTDAEGLQDSIINMAESAVVFNEKTGEFDIPVTEMYRLREAAKLTGIDYQELTETARKAAERTKKLDMLGPMNRYTDEQKEMIANLGDIQDGKVMITLPEKDEDGNEILKAFDAATLGPEQLKKLREQQDMANKSDKDIAVEQLSALETLKGAVDKSGAMKVVLGTKTQGVTDALEAAKAYGQTLNEELDKVFSPENIQDYGTSLTNMLKAGLDNEGAKAEFKQSVGRMTGELVVAFQEAPNELRDKLEEDNTFKNVDFSEMASAFVGSIGMAIGQATDGMLVDIIDGLNVNDATKEAIKQGLEEIGDGLMTFADVASVVMSNLTEIGFSGLDDLIGGGQGTGMGTGPTSEDFILRPGQEPINFRADDLIIGGTKLIEALNLQISDFMTSPMDSNENTISIDKITSSFDKLTSLGQTDSTNSVNGDVNLNVNGKIDLTVDGRNLPQNISSEQLAEEIVRNPDFTSKLMNIFTDAKNTYSS
jgi:hypothetical protein